MTSILTKLKTLFTQRNKTQHPAKPEVISAAPHPESATESTASLNAETLKNLMSALEHTHEGMYDCEETYALLDEYVELIIRSEDDAALLMPYVRHHLEMCPHCHEAYEVLHRILESDSAAELPN